MIAFEEELAVVTRRMQVEGLPESFIRVFAGYYHQLVGGQTGFIPESDIRPVTSLADMTALPDRLAEIGRRALSKTAIIKLNGGLGTSMGLEKAKSLLAVKEGLSFLEITARQSLSAGVPLILMNSFATDADSLEVLQRYFEPGSGLPLSFLQHKQPKIGQTDFRPVDWPQEPELEWCPPGHGDIYIALVTSGTLDSLLRAGYEYAFVSNCDNLGAVVDERLLGYLAESQSPFLMEAADRTSMDNKGGHLALRADGQLILRELAQTPPEDVLAFQDIGRHKYFNTNNLWLNLQALQVVMSQRDNMLGLPMIRNAKTVDPRDDRTPPVYQLETAMGSAIGVFEGAQAVRVPRSRFAPVKRTDDLLAVRSDAYQLTSHFHVIPNPARRLDPLLVDLDEQHYRFVNDLDDSFPFGPPSLVHCASFKVLGKFRFGRGVVCQDDVVLINESAHEVRIPDGACLTGASRYGPSSGNHPSDR